MKKLIAVFGDDCLFSQEMQLGFREFINENKDFNIEDFDIKRDSEISKRFRVFSTPSIIMLNNNTPYCRIIGSIDKKTLYDFYIHECENINAV
jgi:hypothetical protein